jgi:acyl-coenzyme A synthetase/AMP-(fatty) acid ligase
MIFKAGCIVQVDRFHPKTWWRDVGDSRATIVHYLGVMPAILLNSDEKPKHHVRFGYGANANPKDHAAFEERFGFPLVEAWAMTETGGGALAAASREPRHVGTRCFGFPKDDLEIRAAASSPATSRTRRRPRMPGATAGSIPATRCAAARMARCTSSTA